MIKPVEKINILFHKKKQNKILDFLQREGTLEIIEEKNYFRKEEDEIKMENKKIDAQAKKAEGKYVLDFLSSFSKKEKKPLKEKLKGALPVPKIFLTEEKMKAKMKDFNFKKIAGECKNLEAKINKLNNALEGFEEKKEIYKEWRKFPFKMKELNKMENLKVIAGSTLRWNDFKKELEKNLKLFELKAIQKNNNPNEEMKFLLFYHPKIEKEIKEIISKFNIEPNREIENLKETPKAEIEKISKKIKLALQEKKSALKKINKLFFSYNSDLKIIYDYLCWEEKKVEASFLASNTNNAVSLSGWIQKTKIGKLKKGLEKITNNFEIFKVELSKGEEPPIIIENKTFLNPIRIIGNMYDVPKANEMDPTPPMAPFFILFFALCLGDAGYGILFILFSLLGIKFMKAAPEKRDFFYLLMYLGTASCITGALFGGWFGINIEALSPGILRDTLLEMKIIDPLKNPIQMLGLALGLGVVQILCGFFLKMYNTFKIKGAKDAFLNDFPWIYFVVILIVFAAARNGIIYIQENFANYLVFSGFLFIIFTQGRNYKSFAMKLAGGVGKLYDLVGYFSDVVSYSRLLALGLATGVIASVVNLTAGIIGDMIPIFGGLVYFLIIVFGHLFNLAIRVFCFRVYMI